MKRVYKITPDQVTVNTVIDACVEAGNLSEAERLLVDYSSLLSTDTATAAATSATTTAAAGKNMRNAAGVSPGVEAFSSVIAGLADRGDADGAFRVLRAMESREVLFL
jgi:pentatricopeptide repeat protein